MNPNKRRNLLVVRGGALCAIVLVCAGVRLPAQETKPIQAAHAAAPGPTAIPIDLKLLQDVRSATAKAGQSVALAVIHPVTVDGRVVVAAGAQAHGVVTMVRHRGHNRREGRVVITVETVTLANGHTAPIRSQPLTQGTGAGEPIFGPCTFPIPADPAGLFRKGNDVVLPAGTALTASLVQ